MNDVVCVAFIVQRFSNERPIVFVRRSEGESVQVDLAELSSFTLPIVTHDTNLLVETFRLNGLMLPETLIDIAESLRLRSQISKDQGGPKHWIPWRVGKDYFEDRADAQTLERLFQASIVPPTLQELDRLAAAAASALHLLWAEIVEDLKRLGEWARFHEKEVPVQQIFHQRQYRGVRIDASHLSGYIRSCEQEKFSQFRKLSARLGFSPIGLKPAQIADRLFEISSDLPDSLKGTDALEDQLEISKEKSETAFGLLTYIKASRDLSVLRQLQTCKERAYPFFQVHGTVTSRILVAEPRLQQLRKRYRALIAADEGMTLAYLDYAQFEPGILAHLSGDAALLAAYANSDLYLTLSREIYGDEHARDIAKKIFLAYCYGMSRSKIALLLAGANPSSIALNECELAVTQFFARFPSIEEYRCIVQEELRNKGVVGSKMGNYRKRTGEGSLSTKELRWAMNQSVQGTASLIFKEALIGLSAMFGHQSILLPMHDAVLLQFDANVISREQFESQAIEIMRSSFLRYCPRIVPKVTNASFDAV
ncbi:MAG: DNA polymerase [Pseudomonadota bacterium]